jgi:cytochrome c-type biogenesis protein CcmH/NrfG
MILSDSQVMHVSGDRDLAIEIERLSAAVKSSPRNFDLWKRLGLKLQDNSEYTDAIDAFNQALDIRPGNADIVRKISECQRDLKFMNNVGD